MDGPQKRYLVTLNAPTTAAKATEDPLISYVDQDEIYHLSILDTAPSSSEPHQYHTVVRICMDDESQESSSRQSGPSKSSTNPNFCTIEYAPFPQQAGSTVQTLPVLHSSLEKSFSVTWSSSAITGASYCLLPIKFRNATCLGSFPLKICAGTERIRIVDATVSCTESYEESFACVRLFSDGASQVTRAAEVAQVKHEIRLLHVALEQTSIQLDKMILAQKNTDKALSSNNKFEKRATQKRKSALEIDSVAALVRERGNLTHRLTTAHQRLSSVRPVQVFWQIVSVRGEQSQSHMPSEQLKCSKAGTELVRNDKGSKASKNVEIRQKQPFSSMTNACHKVPAGAAKETGKRSPSVVCFYIRPEHLPNSSYTAIYLTEPAFPSLLSGIASKLQVHVGTIGTIYYYDQRMTPVVVNEKSIGSIHHEQDLIVQLPWVANQSFEHSGQPHYQIPSVGDISTSATHEGFEAVCVSESGQTFGNNYATSFDQYLALPPEDSYNASVDSWSEYTDDTSMSRSQMFVQCSTAQTTMSSDDEMYHEAPPFRHQHILGGHGIDQVGNTFDAARNSDMPTTSLSSAPTPAMSQLLTPLPETQQALVPQTDSLALLEREERPVPDCEHSLHKETTATKTLPPGYKPPVSRKYVVKRSTSPRNNGLPQHIKIDDGATDAPKQSKSDRDVVSLERNRLAAMKCRLTRKEKEARLQKLTVEKAEVNAELKREIRRLKVQVAEAKGLLEGHIECD